jgi:hypothetical protein
VAELRRALGEAGAALSCVDLLAGADPRDYADVLPYVGGRAADALLDGRTGPEWARVWGARGLLYVWAPTAGPEVVRGLRDPFWRVAENYLKVCAARELASGATAAAGLTTHRLARVRAQALRLLGAVGDTEHLACVDAALDDQDVTARAAAERAMPRLLERLDVPKRHLPST